jgi:phenylacetic acid degradation operon negative regulatory protein
VGGTTVGESTVDESTAGESTAFGGTVVAGRPADGELPTRMLVLGTARHDGVIVAADAFAVAEICGRSSEQVRSCLRRLVSEGLFAREGVGQRALYRPTEAGVAALLAFADRKRLALRQDSDRDPWDGRWHLVAFAVPEARRTARDALRDHFGRLGGAPIHNGLYVSPHGWERSVVRAAERLGVAAHVTTAATADLAVGGVSDPAALAARLWPLDRLAERYRRFVARWSTVPATLGDMRRHDLRMPDAAYLPGALAMALAFASCFDADPLLPPDLLPQPWPGREARDLLVRSHVLARAVRAEQDLPALFRTLDEIVEGVPPGAGGAPDPAP